MTFEDITKISDIKEKEEKLIEFYINEIGVEKWLIETSKTQKIRFKDRWEYKLNGEYHRLTGPAIDFNNNSRGFYYINGEPMGEEEWKKVSLKLLRERKLKRATK